MTLEHNTFRHIDALEYARVWGNCAALSGADIERRLVRLNERMESLVQRGEEVPTYLYAAYRAYEAYLIFRSDADQFDGPTPFIVKLIDNA